MTDIFKKYDGSKKFSLELKDGCKFIGRVHIRSFQIGSPDIFYTLRLEDGSKNKLEATFSKIGKSLTKGFSDVEKIEDLKYLIDEAREGCIANLSDNSSHIISSCWRVANSISGAYSIKFKDGVQLNGILKDGSSCIEGGIYIDSISVPPEDPVDLSTLKVGDVCINRSGDEIPWRSVLHVEGRSDGDNFIISAKGCYYWLFKNGRFHYGNHEHPRDIVSIRRASKEEKAALAEKIMKE